MTQTFERTGRISVSLVSIWKRGRLLLGEQSMKMLLAQDDCIAAIIEIDFISVLVGLKTDSFSLGEKPSD